MKDLNEIQYFVQVSQTQSFTTAANRLGVPKSSVSRAIVKLEQRLGIKLIERTTRSVSLTEAGELYLDRCQRVLEEAEQADQMLGAMHVKPRGTLRVGAPGPFARMSLAPILGEFLARYPEIRLQLQIIGTEASQREHKLDIVIRPGPLEDSGLLVKPLMQIHLATYASPRYLEGRPVPETPSDLRSHSCIVTSCGAYGEPAESATWKLRRAGEWKEVRVEAKVAVPDPSICYQLTLAGVGIGLLSQPAAQKEVDQGRLVRVLPGWEPEPVELHALYPSQLNASPKVRAFLDFLKER